jgi:hypothetical protein
MDFLHNFNLLDNLHWNMNLEHQHNKNSIKAFIE